MAAGGGGPEAGSHRAAGRTAAGELLAILLQIGWNRSWVLFRSEHYAGPASQSRCCPQLCVCELRKHAGSRRIIGGVAGGLLAAIVWRIEVEGGVQIGCSSRVTGIFYHVLEHTVHENKGAALLCGQRSCSERVSVQADALTASQASVDIVQWWSYLSGMRRSSLGSGLWHSGNYCTPKSVNTLVVLILYRVAFMSI